MVARILGFILQNHSPFKFGNSRAQVMGSKYTNPPYEYPLEVLALLIKSGYEMSPTEKKCLSHYMFLEKLTKHHPKSARMIDLVCKNNPVNSERMAYLILYGVSKVCHSD
jgi:hypothetical protein